MATILHKYGKKASYLSLSSYDSDSLYFCTDSREIFKGEDNYTDAARIIDTYDSLPDFSTAADGKLYICEDTGCGYVMNEARDAWVMAVHGVDEETIGFTTEGLMTVKAVPLSDVTGLSERLSAIEEVIISGGSDEVTGTVDTYEDLPEDAEIGDIYEVTEDGTSYYYNGEEWIVYNPDDSSSTTSNLTPVASATLNSSQLKIDDNNILNIINVDSSLVSYGDDSTVEQTLNSIIQVLSWESMDGTTISASADEATAAITAAEDDTIVTVTEGEIAETMEITASVTVRGANYGVAQNYAQEVE